MRHPFVSTALVILVACGGKSTTPAPPANEVAEAPSDTGGDTYGGWDEGGWGGDTYGGSTYGGAPYVPPPPAPPNLIGTWRTGCVAHGKVYRQTAYVMTGDRWDARVGEFSDAACGKRTSEQRRGGTYAFGEASAIATAWNVTFTIDVREVTADDKTSAKAIAKACGVKLAAKGTADLLAKGCPKLGIAACTTEHDVAALERDKLRLGARIPPADPCVVEQRATALDTTVDLAYVWAPVGIAECDTLVAGLPRVLGCPSFPSDGMLDSFRQMADELRKYNPATSDPAVVQATADACKQANDQMAQALAAMGC